MIHSPHRYSTKHNTLDNLRKMILFSILLALVLFCPVPGSVLKIHRAKIQSPTLVEIFVSNPASIENTDRWFISPEISIDHIGVESNLIRIQTKESFRLDRHYYLHLPDGQKQFLLPDGILDSLYSEKPLGYYTTGGQTVFRVFAPRARWVRLMLFQKYRDSTGKEYQMHHDSDGVWEFTTSEDWRGRFYGYRLWGPQGEGELFDSTIVVADPYSPAVATQNRYDYSGKTLILPEAGFDWQGDSPISIPRRDLIIYEMHVRDLTAHPSSGLPEQNRGSYLSLLEKKQRGGLPYIQSLGVNAVELLPTQDFGNIEVPYRDLKASVFNTWNPYARNHWGYMTSYFFAPESYYASGGSLAPMEYCGTDGRQINEFKQMVREFHKNGIAVLMDVVYNHVSQYDYNPLKYIDKFYYFRINPNCSFSSVSGCGNDLKSERPMARRLIIDSVLHWMREYHIDGFRFDLAKMIDWETCDQILQAARRVNPGVVIIAEPWGGGYDPAGFSDHGWASWNDQIRNGVKGQNPHDGLGFIFGKWQGQNDRKSLQRYIHGSLRKFGGQYLDVSHSVNYLASHDDYTLGDFIRLGVGDVDENQRITDIDSHAKLTAQQMRLNKLAALFLFTSQGAVMIHEGQEFARSKVIAPASAPDPNQGKIDHNSYNKDNPTNWLNFDHAEMNRELVDYYHGLIRMREKHSAFRRSTQSDIHFFDQPDSLFLVFRLDSGRRKYFILLNGNPGTIQHFRLPSAGWRFLVDQSRASDEPFGTVTRNEIEIPPQTGAVFIK